MKTIVIVHHTGDWGGGTKSLIDLCEMLKDDYDVIVCIPKGFPLFAKKIGLCGCRVHEFSVQIPYTNIYSGRPPALSVSMVKSILSLKNIKEIGEEVLALNPDLVIFNTIVASITARYLFNKTKVICVDRETLTSRFSILIYRLLLDNHLDAITFLAEYEQKKLCINGCQSVVFPDCVRLDSLVKASKEEIREKEKIDPKKYAILFMGGLSQIKGTDIILEAMDILDDRFQLIIVGDFNEKKLSKAQLRHDIKYPSIYCFKKRVIKAYYHLKGTGRIIEAGLRSSVDELIIASDVIVFPSTSVHQPRPCIEAGAYKKPVIISNYPETEEYFKNGYNALTFKPGDAKDLASKLVYAAENRKMMEQMGEKNEAMTKLKHDYYKCKETICKLIEKVC